MFSFCFGWKFVNKPVGRGAYVVRGDALRRNSSYCKLSLRRIVYLTQPLYKPFPLIKFHTQREPFESWKLVRVYLSVKYAQQIVDALFYYVSSTLCLKSLHQQYYCVYMCHYIMFVFDNIFVTPAPHIYSYIAEDDTEEEIKFCSEGNEAHPGERCDKSIKLSADTKT